MILLALAGMLIGMVLGARFRFIVLLPIILIVSVAVAGFALLREDGIAAAMLSALAFSVPLQLGYVVIALVVPFITHDENKKFNELPPPGSAWKGSQVVQRRVRPS